MAPSPAIELEIEGRTVRVSNPEKVYFSERGQTKLDLVNYYLSVGPGIVHALFERPCTLQRFPDGVEGEAIYQKRVPEHHPEWLETARVTFPSGRHADELCVTEVASVAWAANLGTIVFHPWPSRRPTPSIRTSCASTSIRNPAPTSTTHGRSLSPSTNCLMKSATSGSRRRQAVVASISTCDCSRAGRSPRFAVGCWRFRARSSDGYLTQVTTAWWKEERGAKVFLDYNQNARDRTIAAAYSVRANVRATVSTPVTWQELADVEPNDFTIDSVPQRFAKIGDLHAGINDVAHDLTPLIEMADRDERDRGLGDAPYPPNFPKMEGEPSRVQPSRARRPKPEAD